MHAARVNGSDWRLPAGISQMAFVDWRALERWVSRAVLYTSHGESGMSAIRSGLRKILSASANGSFSLEAVVRCAQS